MNICVFCASNDTVSEKYRQVARQLGTYLAENEHTLVYGGATGGLMSEVANAAHKASGSIIGVIPRKIVEVGRSSTICDQLFQVEDMSERKEMMKEFADLLIVLPGGIGTLDELFDVLSSGMIGYHDTPTVLVNCDQFYQGLIMQLDTIKKEKLAHEERATEFVITTSLEETLAIINHKSLSL